LTLPPTIFSMFLQGGVSLVRLARVATIAFLTSLMSLAVWKAERAEVCKGNKKLSDDCLRLPCGCLEVGTFFVVEQEPWSPFLGLA
jgi:hypothetical protein